MDTGAAPPDRPWARLGQELVFGLAPGAHPNARCVGWIWRHLARSRCSCGQPCYRRLLTVSRSRCAMLAAAWTNPEPEAIFGQASPLSVTETVYGNLTLSESPMPSPEDRRTIGQVAQRCTEQALSFAPERYRDALTPRRRAADRLDSVCSAAPLGFRTPGPEPEVKVCPRAG